MTDLTQAIADVKAQIDENLPYSMISDDPLRIAENTILNAVASGELREQADADALAELQALRAELAATRAKLAQVVGALKGLDKAATEVSRLGAVTGSQWSRLTVASLAARAILKETTHD